jgi:hypothetical protein
MNVQSVFITDFRDIFAEWVMKRSLIALFLVAFAAHIIYYTITRYLEHRVGGVSTNRRYFTLTYYRQMILSVAVIVASRLQSCHTDGLSDLTV